MAPGRIKKWFKSLPLTSGNHPHHTHQSDASDIAPSTTEATAAATSDLARDVGNQVLAQTEVATQEGTSSGPVYRLDSKMAEEYMKNIKRFRILVMGRANAGKTTILQRVCNSTDKPEILDGKGNKIDSDVVQGTLTRGYHDIKHELVFRSNPGFVFHDSCGFEAGSTQQFDRMKDFVVERATTRSVNERIHAIWFCIPMTDCHRTVTAAEQKFFNECDTGHVPVIVLLTKVDALYLTAIRELLDEGLEIAEAKEKAPKKEGELMEKWLVHTKHELDKCMFPPKGYVSLQRMHQEKADSTVLMQCTASVLNEEALQRLLVSTQQSSIALCVEYAVKRTLRWKMELGLKDRLQINLEEFENELMSWFPNCGGQWREEQWWLWQQWQWEEQRDLGWEEQRRERWGQELKAINELSKFDVDACISMPPLPKDVTLFGKFPSVQSMVEHAIVCLLVTEHSYFLMQQGHHMWQDVLSLGVEEYKTSNILGAVSKAVKAAFHNSNGDVNGLCEAIINIIIENRMSNKLLKEHDRI